MKTNFIGYGLFSEFLKALDHLSPVNLMLTLETNPGKQGFAWCYSVLMISQAKGDEVIYFRFVTAHYQTIGGSLLGPDSTYRSISAKTLTLDILKDFNVRNATLSMPKTLKYLEGDHDLLRYKKDSDLFYIRENTNEEST